MLARFNWRFCLIHFLAIYCMMYAFNAFAFLGYTDLIIAYRLKGRDSFTSLQDVSDFLIALNVAALTGLLATFIISLVIAIRKKIWWLNSLLIFITAGVLNRFDLLGWQYVKYVFSYTLGWINIITVYYVMAGIFLLSLALSLFFSKRTNRYIASDNQVVTAPAP